jgi:DNA-binding NtrC family response regulator
MTSTQQSVLVVDDEPGMRAALAANLQRDGWQVESAGGAAEAVDKFGRCRYPLVVTDMRMPDGDGMQVMRSVRQVAPSTAVILLTAFGSVPEAVLAMRGGAADYLIKPFSFEQLQTAIRRVMSAAPGDARRAETNRSPLVGESPALLRALERAAAAARTDADVLIEAESGTGKELLARFIHEHSQRRGQPFVAVNCAAVPEQLLESELFGHARGAFTGAIAAKQGKFELANRGTLLLDEVGEMPLLLQPKLLRVLQEREFERVGETHTVSLQVRIIATTNLSLRAMVESGRFRADLYYRLNVIPLSLPPLRERSTDIPILAEHFARQIAARSGGPVPHLSASFLAALQEYEWPGNVRELLNLIRRVLALHPAGEIDASCLEDDALISAPVASAGRAASEAQVLLVPGTPMRRLERQLVEQTLLQTSGNRTRAAELLGISVRTIRSRIREYGLPPRRYV